MILSNKLDKKVTKIINRWKEEGWEVLCILPGVSKELESIGAVCHRGACTAGKKDAGWPSSWRRIPLDSPDARTALAASIIAGHKYKGQLRHPILNYFKHWCEWKWLHKLTGNLPIHSFRKPSYIENFWNWIWSKI